ncbi:MAG: hypothetical protein M3138_02560 [Actinomycetota bacterium]|nr:hypothetical protein [Actinomycetota bacterium]
MLESAVSGSRCCFALAIALLEISLFGSGPFFWSLVLGTGVSLVLERDGWKRLRSEAADGRVAPAG